MKQNLPNLFTIGAMKAGSTSLHEILDSHPEINMSKVKEINFFSKNYDKGFEWYQNHFDFNTKYTGESSVSYSRESLFPGTGNRLLETAKEPKIIYIIRNPIERIESDYREHVFQNFIKNRDINLYFTKHEVEKFGSAAYHMIDASCYYKQIKIYADTLGKENVLILRLEDLKNNQSFCLSSITKFLKIKPFSNLTTMRSNSSKQKRQLNSYGILLSRFLSKGNAIIPSSFSKKILDLSVFSNAIPFRKLNSTSISFFRDSLMKDMEMLTSEFDVDTINWQKSLQKKFLN